MIRHIIAAIATLLALWSMVYMYKLDTQSERLNQIKKVIEKSKQEVPVQNNKIEAIQKIDDSSVKEETKKEDEAVAKKLESLKKRAGNIMAFKVSPLYKQKCSSCHGVNGEGIVGPKLIGLSESKIYQALVDFKSGKRKNYVMYGLLTKLSDEDLKKLSKEISTFEQKKRAAGQ
ncbi:c-type cytochrome [Hydrogenimonas thermophila]|uniref:c-type cytochrome n=1 Tax=Hydrogenimonas thermophila TaxID=223786 RepID=UPI0029373A10|nr:c-type cytochrome [Hydrogenimonas thermophila]WOE70806.1 c-type cytochrome [Hydrogenimonas thermophila]WOE73324.1 c-type cytochrome [Hydrogenimonas thermophila]